MRSVRHAPACGAGSRMTRPFLSHFLWVQIPPGGMLPSYPHGLNRGKPHVRQPNKNKPPEGGKGKLMNDSILHESDANGGEHDAIVDLNEASRFLKWLDPWATEFTFQIFDDDKVQKRKHMARVFNGTLEQHAKELIRCNRQGFGVFVTINTTDLCGRKAENITAVRKQFVDTDGAPLKPIWDASKATGLCLACVVESSPGNYHGYWNADCEPGRFSDVQTALAARFSTDPAVFDLSRVMRLPGFYHQKREKGMALEDVVPFMTRIVGFNKSAPAYTPDEMIAGFGLVVGKPASVAEKAAGSAPVSDLNAALTGGMGRPWGAELCKTMVAYLDPDCEEQLWFAVLGAIAKWSSGSDEGRALAESWSRGDYYHA